ncbi:hypothetical protein L21SP5_01140 [Salinivirga cyanobacteriivorans]|uniref:Uncharacterized protein n=1 Tax=Salinivirga cyanobacteriivorans TaxID=1307839 RepID=A0A0S2HXM6_9BACT|nr:hypothetical protein [Salinivirga cyanobacteriivorans]ALO14799.1 hypothetical protein L21SP5_01140 [Salinivirga cyanobacteriivorans]
MKKTKLTRRFLLTLIMIMSFSVNYGQIIKPVVTDVGGGLKQQKFVFVIKANEKFEKPERVVMNDWSPAKEAFNPEKMDEYPKWTFDNFMVYKADGSRVRHLIIKNESTGKYFSYPPGKGVKMRSQEEFDAMFARNEEGKYKNSVEKMYEFLFAPQVKGNYIQLGIPNREGKNMVVTPPYWRTREFKLVLVK